MTPAKEKKSPAVEITEVTTPIFNAEMGARLRLMRMKLLMDQRELGAKLGIGQQQVSRLESGKIVTLERPFTCAKLREVFGDLYMFILLGRNPERFPSGHIGKAYWDHKNAPKGNRTTYRMTEHARLEKERLLRKAGG